MVMTSRGNFWKWDTGPRPRKEMRHNCPKTRSEGTRKSGPHREENHKGECLTSVLRPS